MSDTRIKIDNIIAKYFSEISDIKETPISVEKQDKIGKLLKELEFYTSRIMLFENKENKECSKE